MAGRTPDFRAVSKTGDKRWEKIGAAWAKGDKVSVQLNMTPVPLNGRMNFLLVPYNGRKQAAETEAGLVEA